jgi:hypothetical protein
MFLPAWSQQWGWFCAAVPSVASNERDPSPAAEFSASITPVASTTPWSTSGSLKTRTRAIQAETMKWVALHCVAVEWSKKILFCCQIVWGKELSGAVSLKSSQNRKNYWKTFIWNLMLCEKNPKCIWSVPNAFCIGTHIVSSINTCGCADSSQFLCGGSWYGSARLRFGRTMLGSREMYHPCGNWIKSISTRCWRPRWGRR